MRFWLHCPRRPQGCHCSATPCRSTSSLLTNQRKNFTRNAGMLVVVSAHESIGPWGNALLTLTNVADFVIATPSFIFCVDTEQSVDATRLTEGLHVVTGHVDGECTVAVDNPALCADHRVCSTNGIRTLQHRTYRTVTSPYNSGCLAAKCCPNILFLCQLPPPSPPPPHKTSALLNCNTKTGASCSMPTATCTIPII